MVRVAREIANEDWRILIVLDACRYDYFKRNYKRYLEGDLKKGISSCTSTPMWLEKNFENNGNYKDVIYISGNPHINSKGSRGFNGKELFYKVSDVWDFGWDNKLKTVHPREMNKAFFKELFSNGNKKHRYVLHYLQPHAPFLSMANTSTVGMSFLRRMVKYMGETLRHHVGTERLWYLMRLVAGPNSPFPKFDPYYMAYHYAGKEGLQKAYEHNLIVALQHLKKLVDNINKLGDDRPDGKIIVTADHGELLGEDGCYGHIFENERKPALITVPWLIVNGTNGKKTK